MLGRFKTCDQLLLFFMFYILGILLLSFASFSWAGMYNLLSLVSTFSSWLHRAYTHCYSCLLVSLSIFQCAHRCRWVSKFISLLVWAWIISAIRILSKQVGGLVFMPFPHYATWLLMSLNEMSNVYQFKQYGKLWPFKKCQERVVYLGMCRRYTSNSKVFYFVWI